MFKFRPYQQSADEALDRWLSNPASKGKAGVIVMPTGCGKSLLIAAAAEKTRKLGSTVVIQPSVELLEQNSEKMKDLYGISVSIFSASAGKSELGKMTFATLGSLKGYVEELKMMGVKTLILDECDRGFPPAKYETVTTVKGGIESKKKALVDSVYSTFIEALKPVHIIGFTATPFRLKMAQGSTSLCMMTKVWPSVFTEIIHVEQISTMVEGGYWAQVNYVAYDFDDKLLRVNKAGTDYSEESIAQVNLELNINKNVYYQTRKLLEESEKNQILVCVESVDIANKMQPLIPHSGLVHGKTPKKERREIIRRFKAGELRVLVNVLALNVGFDAPSLTHVILGRPTMSFPVFYQIVGRAVRPHPEGLPATIIDFCGNVKRFGRVEDLKFINDKKAGWLAVLGDRVLTGVKVGSTKTLDEYLKSYSKRKRKKECDTLITFGTKYKNKRVDELPKWYLRWIIGPDFNAADHYKDLIKDIKEYLGE